MARGGVKGFVDLVASVGDGSPVDGQTRGGTSPTRLSASRTAALKDLTTNPYNPRDSIGDLDDLVSIVDHQLQPVVVVTRDAFLGLYPEADISAKWVVVLGNRRLAAALKFGRPDLEISVKDELAKDRATLLSAAITENVGRKGFDVIEEAKAVERLVAELGSADAAGEHLKKSKTWVSHRRGLLKLTPDLQEATRRGDLAIREARALAQVPFEEQVARWKAACDRRRISDSPAGEGSSAKSSRNSGGSTSAARSVTRALRRFDAEPDELATALHEHLGEAGAKALIERLRTLLK
ncbi:putative chromosome-partitioning protein ParB [Mycobacterium marinum]|uniref:ParB/RepB/Spo0J family partition protein n=1 Tax=Mycobacterium marinum TaxID=1781 RepID=UPI000E3CA263|nr:ParB N-terminal domain-containing protein [Mycobacterium marinum]RFZ63227.1 putative chromosome-partitioning protein ParB [Mycobacterium marinum]